MYRRTTTGMELLLSAILAYRRTLTNQFISDRYGELAPSAIRMRMKLQRTRNKSLGDVQQNKTFPVLNENELLSD